MKINTLLVVTFCLGYFFSFSQTYSVDSKEYQEKKANGTIDWDMVTYDQHYLFPKNNKPYVGGNNGSQKSICDCYVEPDSSYTLALAPNDDGSSSIINLPFNFCFYGQTYTSFYINNNGNVTFTGPLATYSSSAFPSVGNQILAPFWADVDTRNGNGQVLYKITPTAVYINWEDVGYYNQHGDKLNTFQLIITDGTDPAVSSGNVAFCYQDMEWTTGDASSGSNGFGGVPATCGANKGDGIGYFLVSQFDHAGIDFDGALGNPDGISWLDNKSFFFDVCNANNVPPVPQGVSNCDTFKVCSFGDTADISITFLSPEAGQTTSITYNNGGLTSLQQLANISGNTANLVLRIIGDASSVGTYTINVTATDDYSPTPGSTTISFVIVIEDSPVPIDPVLDPTQGCDSVLVNVLNGPYETYLWDDLSTQSTNYISQSGIQGVTVSLMGCYKRVTDTFNISTPPVFNLQGSLNICPGDMANVFIPDSTGMDSVIWTQNGTVINTNFSASLSPGTYQITLYDSLSICQSDTTITVVASALPSIFAADTLCNGNTFYQVLGLGGNVPGVWSSPSSEITFSDPNALNPVISTSSPGTYIINYVDGCNDTVSSSLTFTVLPVIFQDTFVCGLSYDVTGTIADPNGGVWSSPDGAISFASSTDLNPTISASTSGQYQIDFEDNLCGHSTSAMIEFVGPPTLMDDTVACYYGIQIVGTDSYNGGIWTATDTAIHIDYPTNLNPYVYTTVDGTYILTYTDTVCNVSEQLEIEFPPYAWTEVVDTVICLGSEFQLYANENPTVDYFEWSTGEIGPSIIVDEAGVYTVTASNECHSITVSSEIGTKICDINVPNVISLSSGVGNDVWGLDVEGVMELSCIITNRWGNVVYEFNDPHGTWEGQTKNGKMCEEGTYFYLINAKFESGEEVQKQGFIELVK